MKKKRRASDIQSVIMTVLSLMTVITSISMGLLLYNRYETAMRQNDVRDAQNMMETIVNSMEQYLKSMRQISDTANYNIIQALDISSPEFNQELSLLYDSNKDKIQSIALYDMEGELLVAEPVTLQKEGVEVSRQSWFENAKAKIENMHFSTPHMQDLFQDDAKRYHWVISLSRAVDVIDGDSPEKFRIYMMIIVIMLIMMLLAVNRIVSKKISSPILKLDASVTAYEAGEKPDIYIGGSYEIRHLGNSVQKSYEEIERLMKEIVEQQNERRKSELAALQSQINPHFLYNTLESITWMIEGNRNQDAVFMISELARLFRISLSRGKTIIRIEDELQHCRNYMNIQKYRYKERFVTEYDVSEEIYPFCTVKLILQPILENAIYYGVGDMDEDDHPRILVRGFKKEEEIYLVVSDNGMGMRREDVENILTDNQKVPKHGSGVGLINVHTRIQLMFGVRYGLTVESEPDEGTTVTIHLPAIPYTKENCEILEAPGKPPRNEVEP